MNSQTIFESGVFDVRIENQQLKQKYKKSLQQLMQILKVNRSLKDHIEELNKNRQINNSIQIQNIQRFYQNQRSQYLNQFESLKAITNNRCKILQENISILQAQNIKLKQQIAVYNANIQQEKDKTKKDKRQNVNQIQIENMKLKQQNIVLTKRISQLSSLDKQKQALRVQFEQLRQQYNEITTQLISQKQKWRHQNLTRQTQYLRTKSYDSQRLKTVQSKCILLETQLNNYKNYEKYFDQQAKAIVNDELLFNNIRQQIDKINKDFNQYELQSLEIIQAKQIQQQDRIRKLTLLQNQLTLKNQQLKSARQEVFSLKKQILEQQRTKQKIAALEKEKNYLLQRNHVLQALTLTQNHRATSGMTERLRQFEIRVNLLINEHGGNIRQSGGLEQIFIMKSYVKQLCEELNSYKKKQEKHTKKIQSLKNKNKQLEQTYAEKINSYKKKIQGFDSLVSRLYSLLEQKMKSKQSEQTQKQFNLTLNKYQQKMLMMSDQIVKLRKLYIDLEKQTKQVSSTMTESERQQYKRLIDQMSLEITHLRQQTNNFLLKQKNNKISEQIIKQKDYTIEELKQSIKKFERQQSLQKQKYIIRINGQQTQLNRLSEKIINLEDDLKKNRQVSLFPQDNSIKLIQIQQYKHESSINEQFQLLLEKNHSLEQQLNSKHEQMMRFYHELMSKEQEVEKCRKIQQMSYQLQIQRHQLIQKYNIQNQEFNSQIISLRTDNLSLKKEIQQKQSFIDELKHQIYSNKLNQQKQRSNDIISTTENQSELLGVFVIMAAEIESLREKNDNIENSFQAELEKYRKTIDSLKLQHDELFARSSKNIPEAIQSSQSIHQLGNSLTSTKVINSYESSPSKAKMVNIGEGSQTHVQAGITVRESPSKIKNVSYKKI